MKVMSSGRGPLDWKRGTSIALAATTVMLLGSAQALAPAPAAAATNEEPAVCQFDEWGFLIGCPTDSGGGDTSGDDTWWDDEEGARDANEELGQWERELAALEDRERARELGLPTAAELARQMQELADQTDRCKGLYRMYWDIGGPTGGSLASQINADARRCTVLTHDEADRLERANRQRSTPKSPSKTESAPKPPSQASETKRPRKKKGGLRNRCRWQLGVVDAG